MNNRKKSRSNGTNKTGGKHPNGFRLQATTAARAVPDPRQRHLGSLTGQMPRPDSGGRYAVTSVPTFSPDHPKAGVPRSPNGSHGVYRVTFILATPGQQIYHTSLDFARIMESGDSLVIGAVDAAWLTMRLVGEGQQVKMVASFTDRKALAKVQMRVEAQDFRDAERFATNLILPCLSQWCYQADVGVDVAAVEIHEERTDVTCWTVGIVGAAKPLPSQMLPASTPALRRLLSAYREGMTNTSSLYRVLSYAKVLEGVRKSRLAREKRIKKAGGLYVGPVEEIPPDTPDFPVRDEQERLRFGPYYGQSFDDVALALRETIRHAVAHLDPEGNSLAADSYDDVAQCEQTSSVLKYMARVVLQHEIKAQAEEAVVTLPEGMELTDLPLISGSEPTVDS